MILLVSVLRGAKPKDQIAAMLLTQMAATQMAVIKYINRLACEKYMEQHDSDERTLNKLLRVFVMQVEAFTRYQNGGERNVTVQNVSVSEVGQAIVGNVTQGALKQPAEMPALSQSKQEAMPPLSNLDGDFETEYRLRMAPHKRSQPPNVEAMLSSARCGAKTRSGKPCRSPAVKGKRRCRMHGGAPGSGAPLGNKNALKHGNYTREALDERRQLQDLLRQSRTLIGKIG